MLHSRVSSRGCCSLSACRPPALGRFSTTPRRCRSAMVRAVIAELATMVRAMSVANPAEIEQRAVDIALSATARRRCRSEISAPFRRVSAEARPPRLAHGFSTAAVPGLEHLSTRWRAEIGESRGRAADRHARESFPQHHRRSGRSFSSDSRPKCWSCVHAVETIMLLISSTKLSRSRALRAGSRRLGASPSGDEASGRFGTSSQSSGGPGAHARFQRHDLRRERRACCGQFRCSIISSVMGSDLRLVHDSWASVERDPGASS